MEFVLAAKEDRQQLLQMRLQFISEDFGAIPMDQKNRIMNQLLQYFDDHIGKDLYVFMAKEHGLIIGVAMLLIVDKPANPRFTNGKIGEVMNVYTHKQYRRQGIATKLLQLLMEMAKQQRLDLVEVEASNEGYPVYQKLGFEEQQLPYRYMQYRF